MWQVVHETSGKPRRAVLPGVGVGLAWAAERSQKTWCWEKELVQPRGVWHRNNFRREKEQRPGVWSNGALGSGRGVSGSVWLGRWRQEARGRAVGGGHKAPETSVCWQGLDSLGYDDYFAF